MFFNFLNYPDSSFLFDGIVQKSMTHTTLKERYNLCFLPVDQKSAVLLVRLALCSHFHKYFYFYNKCFQMSNKQWILFMFISDISISFITTINTYLNNTEKFILTSSGFSLISQVQDPQIHDPRPLQISVLLRNMHSDSS